MSHNQYLLTIRFIMRNAFRAARIWTDRHTGTPPKYVPILLIFITNKCNLKCSMCGIWGHHHATEKRKELSTDEWKRVIHSAASLGTSLISISGGEPLLRPDLFHLIEYAKNKGIMVHICSNGTTLNPDNINRLRDSGVNSISISLDSHIPEIHDSLRGDGTFEKAVQGIRMIHERAPSIKIGINYLINTKNFRNMHKMVAFAEELHVYQIKFAPIHTNLQHKRRRLEDFGDLIFKESDLEELELELEKLLQALARSKLLSNSTEFSTSISTFYRHPLMFCCYAGYISCAIDPFGMVTPCCDIAGNLSIRDKPLDEIWKSEEFHNLRRLVHRCNQQCWDTTNTELSLRLTLGSLLRGIGRTLRELKFYLGASRS